MKNAIEAKEQGSLRGCPIKWIKHDTDANQDAKLQNVLLDYGIEGYGLYWYCIELIAGKVDKENITFELEHDARIIARNVGSTAQKIEEMMKYFVKIGLFECSNNVITCLKLAKRLDKSMTSNPEMRVLIDKLRNNNHDKVMTKSECNHDSIMTESENVMQDKIRLDKNRLDNKNKCRSAPPSYQKKILEIFDYWKVVMKKTGSTTLSAKRKKAIENRLKDGYSVEDIKMAVFNCSNSSHNMGYNERKVKYNDIELICRNPENLERFRDNPGDMKAGIRKTIQSGNRNVNEIGNDFSAPEGWGQ